MEKETTDKIMLTLSQENKATDHFYELLKACNDQQKPDAKARQELQQLIKNEPVYQQLMQRQDGLYANALRIRIERFGSSDAFKELAHAKCNQLRDELGHQLANPLERLAIEQIVLCWLNYHQIELSHANVMAQSPSRETGIYWEKRLAFATRRYNRALETLSKMRKMNLVVQVNHAQNQIVNNRIS